MDQNTRKKTTGFCFVVVVVVVVVVVCLLRSTSCARYSWVKAKDSMPRNAPN
jgi:cytochrome c-type biogenesis protein CcmH/NrfG